MKAWPLNLQLWAVSTGPWPIVLAMAVLLAGGLWGVLVPAAERSASRQQDRLEQARRDHAAGTATPSATEAAAAPVAPLAAFEDSLATDDDVARLMGQVWQQGAQAGLQMNKVDYRSEPDGAGGFARLHLTLPVKGPYPAVKGFVFKLMAAHPGLSLDKLDMKREHATVGEVETTLHLTLLTLP
jgi:Tfp pilus assembly protein PilO